MRGDGRVFKRGNRWWVAYYVREAGVSVEKREPGGKTEKEARNKLKHRIREIGAQDLGVYVFKGPEAERIQMDELFNDLDSHYQKLGRERQRSLSHMRHLRAFFGVEFAIRVQGAMVDQYIAHRREGGASNGTINRELHILRRAFRLAVIPNKKLSVVQIPTISDLSEDNVREGFFEKADFDAVLSHLKDAHVRDFILWAYWTGMRRGEISKLTWKAVDNETSTLILPARSAKSKKSRKLILQGVYRDIIARRRAEQRSDCPFIFHRQGRPMGSFRKAWANACLKVGVAGSIFHDLRRTAVRNMIRSGIDETVAMAISGHATDAIFKRYNITSDDDLRQAQRKLETYVSTLPIQSNVTVLRKVN